MKERGCAYVLGSSLCWAPCRQVQSAMCCHLLGQHPQQHKAEGLTFPPIQSLQFLESILAGHKYHLENCTSAFCVAVVWFGFSPCPYSVFECMCCESSSNISAPQGNRVSLMWVCLGKAENWQVSSNLCFSELTVLRKFGVHPTLHSCLSKKSEAKNRMLQVWCCLVTSEPAHQLGQVRVATLRQSR